MYRTDIRDLCRQVHVFCLQLQQIRPGVQADTEKYLQDLIDRAGITEPSDESPVDVHISSTLVTVKSIEELVQQNVDLRRVARNLARQSEAAHSQLEKQREEHTSAEVLRLTTRVQTLEVENEKLSRQLRYVLKQRNDLKVLVGRGGSNHSAQSPAKNHVDSQRSSTNGARMDSSQSAHRYEQLEEQNNRLREETDMFRDRTAEFKKLSAEVDRLNTENTNLKIEKSKCEHQLDARECEYARVSAFGLRRPVLLKHVLFCQSSVPDSCCHR